MEDFREWFDIEKLVNEYEGRADQFCADPLSEEHRQNLDDYEFVKIREQLANAISSHTGVEYHPRPGFWVSLDRGDSRKQLKEKLERLYRSLEIYENLEQSEKVKIIEEDSQEKIIEIRTNAQTELSKLVKSVVLE